MARRALRRLRPGRGAERDLEMSPVPRLKHLCLVALGLSVLGVGTGVSAQRLPVEHVRFHAPSVDREMTFAVILPEGYELPENRDRRYPTLYLLHGYGNSYEGWSRFMGIPTYARDHELIIVMPDAGNSYYVNWAETDAGRAENWEDYVVRDLIGHVEATYRAVSRREGRAITGFSMGGYGALTIGLRNPHLFASVGSQSGALEFGRRAAERLRRGETATPPRESSPERQALLDRPNPLLDLPGFSSVNERTPAGQPFVSEAEALEHDPFSLVLRVPRAELPLIQIDCGSGDRLSAVNQELARLLMEHGIPFDYQQLDGGHDPAYWIQAYGYAVAWHDEVMQRALGQRPIVVRR